LREILSHQLVAYHEDTGQDVVKDHESMNRQIELKAKLGKPRSIRRGCRWDSAALQLARGDPDATASSAP
jgi:hypothetical protein